MMIEAKPFDDVRALLQKLPAPEEAASAAVKHYLQQQGFSDNNKVMQGLTHLAAWCGKKEKGVKAVSILRPNLVLFASSHAVLAEKTQSQRRTRAALSAIFSREANITKLCANLDVGMQAFDLAVDLPVPDISVLADPPEKASAATLAFGMEASAQGADLLGFSTLSPGGELAAASLYALLEGEDGVENALEAEGEAAFGAQKREVFRVTLALHKPIYETSGSDPLTALRCVGGRTIPALCGAILATRLARIPVLLEGAEAFLAALVLHKLAPQAIEHVLFCSTNNPIERLVLARLGKPVFENANGAAPAGASAAFAVSFLRGACCLL